MTILVRLFSMSSQLPGFSYDVFISYRQNDNRSGWVTEFVNHLQEELAAAIKEPVSVYFDANPRDGLLETHDVDESLREKLKCLIFIPIISQTYCDTHSFAWEHEFLKFKQLASQDGLGLKVKVTNGNLASRILPICIHELEAADTELLESELGVVRGIDLSYRTAGVVRPLEAREENPKANLNQIFYKDQVNKAARAVKELLVGIKGTGTVKSGVTAVAKTTVSPRIKKRLAVVASVVGLLAVLSFGYYYIGGYGDSVDNVDRSIAVLPFENMNQDPEQDYFTNGMAEDILNHLAKVSDLKVKSRTSTLQYKGTTKPMNVIGEELSVGNIVEGSVRRVNDKVRIVVQLIDAKTDVHLWSETYDREFKDVLALQSEIAIEISRALEARLTSGEKEKINKRISQNSTAYDYYLKARDLYYQYSDKASMEHALALIHRATALDPGFSRAYALQARVWGSMGYIGSSQKVWVDSVMWYADKAISSDPSSPDGYLVQADIHRYFGRIDQSRSLYKKAYEIAPSDPGVADSYGYMLLRIGDEHGADLVLGSLEQQYSSTDYQYSVLMGDVSYFIQDTAAYEQYARRSKELSPGALLPYVRLANIYLDTKQYDKAIAEAEAARKLHPNEQFIIDGLAWCYFKKGDLKTAAKYWSMYPEIEARFDDTTHTVPFRARLGMTYALLGRKAEADALFKEDIKIRQELLTGKRSMGTWANRGSVYYDLALGETYFGNEARAVQCLDSAYQLEFYYDLGYQNDPMFARLLDREDFKRLRKKIEGRLEFRRRAFTNALNRREASTELKSSIR
jgi:TolB-like protein